MAATKLPRRKLALRPLLRAIHRDVGYLAVGLTIIYALSGLAVNHIAQWDPNFQNYERTHELGPIAGDDRVIISTVTGKLDIDEAPGDVFRASPTELVVTYEKRTLHIDPQSGTVIDEGQDERFFLRVANWLHLNRGKKAWTYAADTYAVALLFLAVSGLFMIKGRKGLIGRGLVFVVLGIAVPVVYVTLSGGP
jgi:uncharacterized protein